MFIMMNKQVILFSILVLIIALLAVQLVLIAKILKLCKSQKSEKDGADGDHDAVAAPIETIDETVKPEIIECERIAFESLGKARFDDDFAKSMDELERRINEILRSFRTIGTRPGISLPKDSEKTPSTTDRGKESKEVRSDEGSEKKMVLTAIKARIQPVEEKDLPRVEKELTTFFEKFGNVDYLQDLASKDYYRLIDLRKNPTARVVTVGDIHCDLTSLVAMLLKLSVSREYDYFKNAYFVFLGDYLDRGSALFETLLLLSDLKKILGERMIMLKGNHELIRYSEKSEILKSKVIPNQSCECLNKYCSGSKSFLQKFAGFFSTLPTYAYLMTTKRNILLTHAAVPRNKFISQIGFSSDGSIAFKPGVPKTGYLSIRKQVFADMIWGDPAEVPERIQTEGRFEFGSEQFGEWMKCNSIDMLVRSHEEKEFGFMFYFENKLLSLFSSGGKDNPLTGYPNVEPAFCVVKQDEDIVENSFTYKIMNEGQTCCINLFQKIEFTEKQAQNFKMDAEFACGEEDVNLIRGIFKTIKKNYNE